MRPTPAEELAAMARTLDQAVAPAVNDDYAATQLGQVVDGLRRLGGDWEGAAASLDAECAALERFLQTLSGIVPVEIPSMTSDAEWANATAAMRQEKLRSALDGALRLLDTADDSPAAREARAATMAFLRESADHWRM